MAKRAKHLVIEEGERIVVRGETFIVGEMSDDFGDEDLEVAGEGGWVKIRTSDGEYEFNVPECLLLEIKDKREANRRLRAKMAKLRPEARERR